MHPRLLAARIFSAGDLSSGKQDARSLRKELIAQVEKLIEVVEVQVKLCDELKSRSTSTDEGK